jgi:hypothetical protein
VDEEERPTSGGRSARPRHLLAVINDLLDLAKAEADGSSSGFVADVSPTIRAAVDAIGSMASAKGLAVLVDVPGSLPRRSTPRGSGRRFNFGNAVKSPIKEVWSALGWTRPRSSCRSRTRAPASPERRVALFSKYAQADRHHRRQRGTVSTWDQPRTRGVHEGPSA